MAEERIAKFKFSERLEIVDEFPISPAGKNLRRSSASGSPTESAPRRIPNNRPETAK